jgi:tetratricopeptide (TPR) repeat protein
MLLRKIANYSTLIVVLGMIFCAQVLYANSNYSDTSRVNSCLRNAKTALDSNKLIESIKLTKEAFQQSSKLDYTIGKAKSLLITGQIQSLKGYKDSSLRSYKQTLALFHKAKDEYSIGEVLNKIGNTFYDSGNQDSAEYYYNKALKVRQKIEDKKGVAGTINNLGLVYTARGIYSKALEYYYLALSIREEIGDRINQPSTLSNIGIVYWNQGDFPKSLEFFTKSLNIAKDLKDSKSIGYIYNNMGLVYSHSGDYQSALKYQNESLRIKLSHDDKLGISFSYMNLGDIYQKLGDYKKALDYYLKAEILMKELANFSSLANLYINMGKLHRSMKNLITSLEILKQAESIYRRIDEPSGIANSIIQIGLTQFDLGQKSEAINNCNQGITLAKQIGALETVKLGYISLSGIYEKIGNFPQAFDNYKLYIVFRDSINSIEKSKQIIKIQLQSEYEQLMQKQKIEQDKNLAIAQVKSSKQTKVANIFILAFALTLSVSILFFISFRQKQRNNDVLAFQKLDMERQKSELTYQRDELEIQKNLVIHQRDKIMTMLTELGESIDYARKIQQALLPSDKTLEGALNSYFLLFQPRESVGGDFYWVAQNEHLTFFAIADCTGHGVPGGFMSMLGVSLLNELVSRSDCNSPAKVLWNLRDMIIRALNQTGLDEDSQDGMDIALCMYNSQNHHIVFSGANLSLVLATSTKFEPSDRVFVHDNIVEFKSDRMPVAYYQRMVEYHEHHIDLSPGDTIYLFSDGYSDQFGGPLNKKYGYTTFRNLIASTSKKPFENQRDIFWNEFDKWKGDENQTDDVIVMGIKII